MDCGEPGLVKDGSLVAVEVGEGTELGSRRTLVCREGRGLPTMDENLRDVFQSDHSPEELHFLFSTE